MDVITSSTNSAEDVIIKFNDQVGKIQIEKFEASQKILDGAAKSPQQPLLGY